MITKKITATKLREDIYNILDEISATGIAVEVTRNGHSLKIVPSSPPSKLKRLKKRKVIKGDPESLVHVDWSSEWSETK